MLIRRGYMRLRESTISVLNNKLLGQNKSACVTVNITMHRTETSASANSRASAKSTASRYTQRAGDSRVRLMHSSVPRHLCLGTVNGYAQDEALYRPSVAGLPTAQKGSDRHPITSANQAKRSRRTARVRPWRSLWWKATMAACVASDVAKCTVPYPCGHHTQNQGMRSAINHTMESS